MKSLVQFLIEAQDGKMVPTVEWMKEHYEKFNKELFDNELPKEIRLGLISEKTNNTLGWQGFDESYVYYRNRQRNGKCIMYRINKKYENEYLKGPNKKKVPMYNPDIVEEITNFKELKPFIELSPKYRFTISQLEDTIIHEMIHLWTFIDSLCPLQLHGSEFKKKTKEIKKKYKELYDKECDLDVKSNEYYELVEDPKMAERIKAAASDTYSIYYVIDDKKFPHRITFSKKKTLDDFIKEINRLHTGKVKEMWISNLSYEPMSKKYGKFPVSRTLKRCFDATQFDKDLYMNGAVNVLEMNEGLLQKISSFIKNIMSPAILVTKSEPMSEIDLKTVFDKEESTDEDDEITGDSNILNKEILY